MLFFNGIGRSKCVSSVQFTTDIMNQRLLWTTAALLITALGTQLSSSVKPVRATEPSKTDKQVTSTQPESTDQPSDVVKVGEYQVATRADNLVAKVQTHELRGRHGATLYVHNIPVLTFLGSNSVATSGTKVGVVGDGDNEANTEVGRATAVAAKLNQLSQERMDASKITVNWVTEGNPQSSKAASNAQPQGHYLIKFQDQALAEINAQTQLPDTTNDLAKDALQATNRLRRLLGNAQPLSEISGRRAPQLKLPRSISLGPVRISFSGMASWYGPEFSGNQSASGEVFNPNALTAAHRSLPFGTRVKVTNLITGRSIVVRINDRGPYIHGRIIDLSTAAARLIGLVELGVAPVHLEVLTQRVLSQRTPSSKRQATVSLAQMKS